MAPLKTNCYLGSPGTDDFHYKLPKYVTVRSLKTAVQHLNLSYDKYGQDGDKSRTQYVTDLMANILPHLDKVICEHFVLKHDVTESQNGDEAASDEEAEPSSIDHNANSKNSESQTINEQCCKCNTTASSLASLQTQLQSLSESLNAIVLSSKQDSPATHLSDDCRATRPQPPPNNSVTSPNQSIAEQLNAYKEKHKRLQATINRRTSSSSRIVDSKKVNKADVLIVGDSMTRSIDPSKLSAAFQDQM